MTSSTARRGRVAADRSGSAPSDPSTEDMWKVRGPGNTVAIGLVIALDEVATGIGALLGLLTRIASVGGMLLSFSLFLVISLHTPPYNSGSDIVFLFAWIPVAR